MDEIELGTLVVFNTGVEVGNGVEVEVGVGGGLGWASGAVGVVVGKSLAG